MAPTPSPVWQYLTKAADAASVGNSKATCKGCGKIATQAPAQWWAHFKDCNGSEDEEAQQGALDAAKKFFREKEEAASKAARINSKSKQATIPELSKEQLFAQADEAIGRFVFANGLPLRLVDDFYLREAFKAIAKAGPNRKQLGRKRLKEQLLPAEKKKARIQQAEAASQEGTLFGKCIVSDGWQSATGTPVINVLLVTPSRETFVKAIDTTGETKNMQYIANKLSDHITEDVDFVVMDGACSGAIALLEGMHPHLSGVVCATHSLDLLLEDIGQMDFAADTLAAARDAVHFINKHQRTRALFATHSDVKLLAPSMTRFGCHLMMLQRLVRCEDALRALVSSNQWREWRNAQKPETREHAR